MLTGQRFPLVCVPTDYGAEGLWPHRFTDLFCAADDEMVKELTPRKVPLDRIKVTGIPVRKRFSQPADRDHTLERFGLPEDKINVMVMAGARLAQPYMPFRAIMADVIDKLGDFPLMHFSFLGADEEYAEHLKHELEQAGVVTLRCSTISRTFPP